MELPDRPGALSRVAGIIGECGGNVVSVDVQEVEGTLAVDELVVDLPDDVDGDTLRGRLDEDRAGILLSIQGARPYSDMVLRAMQWTEALLESRQSERSDMLASALADLCSASGAWVADSVSDARQFEAGRFALERGAPVAHRTDTIPVGVAPDLADGAWLLGGARPRDRAASRGVLGSAAATAIHRDRDRSCRRAPPYVPHARSAA